MCAINNCRGIDQREQVSQQHQHTRVPEGGVSSCRELAPVPTVVPMPLQDEQQSHRQTAASACRNRAHCTPTHRPALPRPAPPTVAAAINCNHAPLELLESSWASPASSVWQGGAAGRPQGQKFRVAANSGPYGVAIDGYAPYNACHRRAGDAGNRNPRAR